MTRPIHILAPALATVMLGVGWSPPLAAQSISPDEARAIAKEASSTASRSWTATASSILTSSTEATPSSRRLEHALQQRACLHARRQGDSDAELGHAVFLCRRRPASGALGVHACRRSRRAATTRCSSSICTRSTLPMWAVARPATAQAAICWPGRSWKGEKPKGVKSVIRCETDFAFVLYRTQLFDPGDIENVKKIQAGYKVAAALAVPRASPRPPLRRRSTS